MSSYFNHINIRDPLYGFIGISKLETKVIDTPIFQRLRRIKQLSNTYIVYPAAMHTRFEHSLGTLHLSGIVAHKLRLNKKDTIILRLCALLHDIGHGPYSHSFEISMQQIMGKDNYDHEKITRYLIEYDEKLKKALGNRQDDVLDLLNNKQDIRNRIISSAFDIDKMDYFRRDSYHTGVLYGMFDYDRIIMSLCKIERFGEQYFGVHEKGMRAIESYRLARFNLWDQVYEHHTRVVADNMMIRGIINAVKEKCLDIDKLTPKRENSAKFCEYFVTLDDHSLVSNIEANSSGKAKNIFQAIKNRNLLKRAYRIQINEFGIPDAINRKRIINLDLTETEKVICNEIGLNEDDLIIYSQNFPIKGYGISRDPPEESEEFLILMKNNDVKNLDELSPLQLKLRSIRRLYVFCKGTKKCLDQVRVLCKEKFQAESDL